MSVDFYRWTRYVCFSSLNINTHMRPLSFLRVNRSCSKFSERPCPSHPAPISAAAVPLPSFPTFPRERNVRDEQTHLTVSTYSDKKSWIHRHYCPQTITVAIDPMKTVVSWNNARSVRGHLQSGRARIPSGVKCCFMFQKR